MARPVLQLWRFDESEYDRPNQGYVCGKQAAGTPCRIGPDAGGACLATFECMPRKDGAHHRCTRPESAGGKCSEGPSKEGVCAHAITKCEPVRSWKAKRRLFSLGLAVAALAAGLAATFSRGPVSNAFVSPGPLSSAHAAADADCGDCHNAAGRGLVTAVLDPEPDGERCLACHTEAAGPNAHSPHGREGTGPGSSRLLDCANCHPEHRGDAVVVMRGGDAACRSCHPDAAGSFAASHPEFESLGSGVSRLNFDHTSKGHQAESCESCHVLDGEGRRRVLPGFQAACSRCHLEEIAKPDAVVWKDPWSIRRESSPVSEHWESDLRALTCRVPVAPSGSTRKREATFIRESEPASTSDEADPMTLPPPVPAAAIASRAWLVAGSTRVQPASFAPGLPATGEWFDDGEALSYRPLVHGDPVMREWLELVARHAGRRPRYKDDGGRCTVCHALALEFPPAMAWTGFRDDSRVTRFSHRAHGEVACADCHTPSEKTFAGVTKAACSGCHARGKAPDGCLTCHGYHDVRPGVPAPVAETVTGPAACEGCHATASKAWAASAHASSRLDTEERRASAAEIAGKLGVKDPVSDARCTGCHATLATSGPIAGVSCESCHGAARAWIGVHADLGVADRGERAAAGGMIRAEDAFALADGCLACHVVADPALVAAGHLSGSPMDAVLWSQGEVRHGFGDGCTGAETDVNREMPADRRRTLFVTGALLDLSRSLAALSLAPGPGDYADAMKSRVKKAAKKLRKTAGAAPALDAELTPVLEAIDALELDGESLPTAGTLGAASAKAREAAAHVAGSRSPAAVDSLDDAIGAKIKGAPWTPG